MRLVHALVASALSGLAASQGYNTTTVQIVTVGAAEQLRFNPAVVNAAVGTHIVFEFYPRNHSVAQGSFQSPCSPTDNAFYSGYIPSSAGGASTSFVITVQDTNPIYYYCSQAQHCQAGMVGIINPSLAENTSFAVYNRTASTSANNVTPPNGVQGGTLVTGGQNTTAANSSSTASISTATTTEAGPASGTAAGSISGSASGTASETASETSSGTGSVAGSATGSAPATSSTTAAAARVLMNGILGGLGGIAAMGMGIL